MHILRAFPLLLLAGLTVAACKPAPTPDTDGTMQLSFSDLVDLGQDYVCTFDEERPNGARAKGTVYMQGRGKNFRGDFDIVDVGGAAFNSHMIRSGSTGYMWTSHMPQGITMEMHDEVKLFNDDAAEQTGVDGETPMDFTCESWSPDPEMFTPPADREFMDMSQMMQLFMGEALPDGTPIELPDRMMGNEGMMMQNDASKAQQCLACEQVPTAAAKEQCKAALGC